MHEISAGTLTHLDPSGNTHTLSFRDDDDGNEIVRWSRPGTGVGINTNLLWFGFFTGSAGSLNNQYLTGLNASGVDVTWTFEYRDSITVTGEASSRAIDGLRTDESGQGVSLLAATVDHEFGDGWIRQSLTRTPATNSPLFFAMAIARHKTTWTSIEIRKLQCETKSHSTNFVGSERKADDDDYLLNLADTGTFPGHFINGPDCSGLHKKEGSMVNIPMINGYTQFNGVDQSILASGDTSYLEQVGGVTLEFVTERLNTVNGALWGRNATWPTLGFSSTTPYYQYRDNSITSRTFYATNSIGLFNKAHVTLTLDMYPDSTQMSFYINGVLNKTEMRDHYKQDGDVAEIMLAARKPIGEDPLNCKIYLFRQYNQVLTPTEVLNNYNNLKGRFGL
jgi:hypothetical protein